MFKKKNLQVNVTCIRYLSPYTLLACLSGVAVVTLNTPCRNELEKFMKLRSI